MTQPCKLESDKYDLQQLSFLFYLLPSLFLMGSVLNYEKTNIFWAGGRGGIKNILK